MSPTSEIKINLENIRIIVVLVASHWRSLRLQCERRASESWRDWMIKKLAPHGPPSKRVF
jgi:hypothetical protein